MNCSALRQSLLAILAMAMTTTVSYAGIETTINLGPIQVNGGTPSTTSLTVEDPWYNDQIDPNNYDFKTIEAEGIVMLSWTDEALAAAFDQGATAEEAAMACSLDVSVTAWDGAGQPIAINPDDVPAVLVMLGGVGNHTHRKIWKVPGAHKLTVSVTGGSVTAPVNQPLELQVQTRLTRFHDVGVDNPPTQINHATTKLSSEGVLVVNWQHTPGAEYYDLEWGYLNTIKGEWDESLRKFVEEESSEQEVVIPKNFFRNNSTRISTSHNSYEIPVIYDKGYIVYRLRHVGRDRVNNFATLIEGKWSLSDEEHALSDIGSKQSFEGHNMPLNWQMTTNFAEEGKRKSVVTYFDGSLRSRQVVSQISSTKDVIAGETIYDYEGRPAVQVLPTPIEADKIEFQPLLNQSEEFQGKAYSADDFDKDHAENDCELRATAPMRDIDGASRFYSPNNHDLEENKLIPHAHGYPFTVIEYTQDNTGRVARQGGVGPHHQLGTGHETQYFYAPASAQELNRLFGYDVGNHSHYKKNMVIDANGQVTVSYLDPAGRVIATGVAGQPKHVELDDILGDNEWTKKAEFNSHDVNVKDLESGQITINSEVPVVEKVVYTGSYNFTGANYEVLCQATGAPKKCYGCVYELDISLKDKCGNEYLYDLDNDGNPDEYDLIDEQLGTIAPESDPSNNSCPEIPTYNTPGNGDWKTTDVNGNEKALEVGTYTLTKTLKLNKEILEDYVEDHINKSVGDCLPTLQDLIDEEMAAVDTSALGCQLSGCDDCLYDLFLPWNSLVSETIDRFNYTANWDDPNNPYNIENASCITCMTLREFQIQVNECVFLCDAPSPCELKWEAMAKDMSPGGQYGQTHIGGIQSVTAPATATVNPEFTAPEGQSVFDQEFDVVDKVSIYYTFKGYPQEAPQSVYNTVPNSDLQERSWATSTNGIPSWRDPYNPYAEADYINVYQDQYGDTAYIEVKKVGASTYEPELITGAIVQRHPYLPGALATTPNFLLRSSDFVDLFEPSWGDALVAYHPEFPYYVACRELNDFDAYDFEFSMQTASTKEEFFNNIEITSEQVQVLTGGQIETDPTLIPLSNLADIDPFMDYSFLTTGVENVGTLFGDGTMGAGAPAIPPIVGYAIGSMKDVVEEYFKNSDPDTTIYSMEEMALVMAHCQGVQSSCQDACLSTYGNSIISASNEEAWSYFKSLYLSQRQRTQERIYNWIAVRLGSYNGCIGKTAAEFDEGLYSWHYFGTGSGKRACNSNYRDNYTNKSQVFPSVDMAVPMIETNACYEIDYNDGDLKPFPDDCDWATTSPMAERLAAVEAEGIQALYDECGKCQNEMDLELFIQGLVNNDLFHNSGTVNKSFGCGNSNYVKGTFMTERFRDNIRGSGSLEHLSLTHGAADPAVPGFSDFRVSFSSGGQVHMFMPNFGGLFDFGDITNVCCLEGGTTNVTNQGSTSKNFFTTASVTKDGKDYEVRLEGFWNGPSLIDCDENGINPVATIDCNGEFGGEAFYDNCNNCVGGSTGATPCSLDCNGQYENAYYDQCGTCVGGSTGLVACVQDCNGEWGGNADIDPCGDCAGGSTGVTPCPGSGGGCVARSGQYRDLVNLLSEEKVGANNTGHALLYDFPYESGNIEAGASDPNPITNTATINLLVDTWFTTYSSSDNFEVEIKGEGTFGTDFLNQDEGINAQSASVATEVQPYLNELNEHVIRVRILVNGGGTSDSELEFYIAHDLYHLGPGYQTVLAVEDFESSGQLFPLTTEEMNEINNDSYVLDFVDAGFDIMRVQMTVDAAQIIPYYSGGSDDPDHILLFTNDNLFCE